MGRLVVKRYVARVGYCLLVLGCLLLSPLADLLPVELAMPISSWFESHAEHKYFRIVPAAKGQTPAYLVIAVSLIAVGLILVFVARLLSRRH